MKKTLIILGIVLICLVAFFLLKNKSQQVQTPMTVIVTNEASPDTFTNQPPDINKPPIITEKPTNEVVSNKTAMVSEVEPVSKFENISDLKKIQSLKLLQPYPNTQSWISDHVLVPFQLKGQNGKLVVFEADFIDAEIITESGRVQELDLHSAPLNIDQVRELGLQLDKTFGLDSEAFLAWCDEVADRKIDIKEFSSKIGASLDSSKVVGFGVHPTFNNEKPLYVRFILKDK